MRTLKGILIATLIFTLFISSATPTLAKEEQSSSETPILVKEELNMDDGPSMGTFAVIEPGPGDPPFKLVDQYTSSSIVNDIGDKIGRELPLYAGGYGGFVLSQAAKKAITKWSSTYAGGLLGRQIQADNPGTSRVYYRTYKYISVGRKVSVAYKVMVYSNSSRTKLIDSYWAVRYNVY